MNENKLSTCCFFGHRKIEITDELTNRLNTVIEKLIRFKKIDTFLFCSKSEFDELCLKTVTKLKKKYTHIKRIYVRAEFPYISDSYKAYLLESYDDTYYPRRLTNAGRAVYIKRNYEMIDNSDFCVTYYDENYKPYVQKSSGTRLAYDYAKKKNLIIINVR